MVTTGLPDSSANKTEAVDVESGETCADLVDFPSEIYGAVGTNLDGTPIVCGGSFSSTYNLDAVGSWQIILPMPNLERPN